MPTLHRRDRGLDDCKRIPRHATIDPPGLYKANGLARIATMGCFELEATTIEQVFEIITAIQ